MNSTKEERVPEINESTPYEWGKKKVVEVPKYDVPRVRHDVPDYTPRPTIFDWLGGSHPTWGERTK